MAGKSKNELNEELAEELENADAVHRLLENHGGKIALDSARLRKIYKRIVHLSGQVRQIGYYSRFQYPIDAIVAYLFLNPGPHNRAKDVPDMITQLGFTKREPIKAIRDAIYNQTKEGKNGQLNINDVDGFLYLTDIGTEKGQELMKKYGSPPGTEDENAP